MLAILAKVASVASADHLVSARTIQEQQAEDATSTFYSCLYFTEMAQTSTATKQPPTQYLAKRRDAWNGGCCQDPIVDDYYFSADGQLVAVYTFRTSDRQAISDCSAVQPAEWLSKIELKNGNIMQSTCYDHEAGVIRACDTEDKVRRLDYLNAQQALETQAEEPAELDDELGQRTIHMRFHSE